MILIVSFGQTRINQPYPNNTPNSQIMNIIPSAAIAIRKRQLPAIHPPAIAPSNASSVFPSPPKYPITAPMITAITITYNHMSFLLFAHCSPEAGG